MSSWLFKCNELRTKQVMIVLIGDSAAGKSCLLKRFQEPNSNLFENEQAHGATVGVDFVVRPIQIGN